MKFVLIAVAVMFMACSSAKKLQETTLAKTPNPAPKEQNSTQSNSKVDTSVIKKELCELGEDKRWLEIYKKPTGCELAYTKFGKEKIVATSKFGNKHCQESLQKITKKLEADKFNCQEN